MQFTFSRNFINEATPKTQKTRTTEKDENAEILIIMDLQNVKMLFDDNFLSKTNFGVVS
jgi:hypothetical protein